MPILRPANGDRIVLTHMGPDPDPLPAGATGTVKWSHYVPSDGIGGDAFIQMSVAWDKPHERRGLMLTCPPDRFAVIEEARAGVPPSALRDSLVRQGRQRPAATTDQGLLSTSAQD